MITNLQKTLTILQLCAAFSLFLCFLCDPFMGEHYRIKKDIVLIDNLTGQIEATKHNQVRFDALDTGLKQNLINNRNHLVHKLEGSFFTKLEHGLYNLLVKTPVFALAWIFFTSLIGIYCLKEKEGAFSATVILPLIVVLYGMDRPHTASPTKTLFPTEETIVNNYLKHPLSADLSLQIEELTLGFDRWLIENWTQQTPSADKALFEEQKMAATYLFNLALYEERAKTNFEPTQQNESTLLFLTYFLWNTGYMFTMNFRTNRGRYRQNNLQEPQKISA